MINLLGEILIIIEEFKFWKKKKSRRKFERENNLPKKTMFHPFVKLLMISLGLIIFARIIIGYFYLSDKGEKITKDKITEIERILQKEKKDLGLFPERLELIIRNNPLRKNIRFDYWDNEFIYTQLDNGDNYELISSGKDGKINTPDDIKADKNLP